jgi:hypothetical protein
VEPRVDARVEGVRIGQEGLDDLARDHVDRLVPRGLRGRLLQDLVVARDGDRHRVATGTVDAQEGGEQSRVVAAPVGVHGGADVLADPRQPVGRELVGGDQGDHAALTPRSGEPFP